MSKILNFDTAPLTIEVEDIQVSITFAASSDPAILESTQKMLLTHYEEAAQQ